MSGKRSDKVGVYFDKPLWAWHIWSSFLDLEPCPGPWAGVSRPGVPPAACHGMGLQYFMHPRYKETHASANVITLEAFGRVLNIKNRFSPYSSCPQYSN